MSPSGVAATAANTVKVNIRAASGTGAGAQTTTIDETAGNLMAANRNLKLSVLTGTNDRLVIRKGAGNDLISLRDQTGLGLGPAIDLDYDGLVDLTMTTDDTVVEVDGGVGNDVIDGWSVHSYRMLLRGEDDSDQLYGGYNTDKLDGGFGDDHLYGRDGVSESIVGGGGYDDAQVDPGDSIPGVEAPRF
jgi:hypothetical protein